jgi:hypothetical protein
MIKGYLSNYFTGIAAKKLSNVESNPEISNQHEFNGVAQLKKLFGTERKKVSAQFLYLSDEEDQRILNDGFLTWYDARENHPTRSEYRLYFPSNSVTSISEAEDLLIISKRQDDSYVVIITPSKSTFESQLIWLFNLSSNLEGFDAKIFEDQEDKELDYASKFILEELGIEVEETDENFLDLIFEKFGKAFPPTYAFSVFARSTLPEVLAIENPDEAILKWMEREELLFKTLEEYLVSQKLENGFEDVDSFISYSLSVQNRRKSRAGYALEYHLAQVFDEFGLNYSHGKMTENRSKPDFLFPEIEKYHNESYPENCLDMLGVKSTCKDRWRQVLSEAARIEEKHLFTLEPGISENQTNEMKANKLQLVLPDSLHSSFKEVQKSYLLNLAEFIDFISHRQEVC